MYLDLQLISLTRIVSALTSLLLLDSIWFSFSLGLVYPKFTNVRIGWGFLAWIPLAMILASIKNENIKSAIVNGAMIGFVIYAVFNGTELAIRPDWTVFVAILDLLWGIFICASVSLILYYTLGN